MKIPKLRRWRYYILLHIIVLAYGFTGIMGKTIKLDFYSIVFFRMLIAGISLFLFLLIMRKSFRIRNRKFLFKTLLVGGIVALHWLTFYKSIQVATASLGVLCLSTGALHVSWLDPIIMKRKFSWVEFWLGVLVVIGVIVISSDLGGNAIQGLIWGLLSGFLAALFSVLNADLNKVDKVPATSLTLYEMMIGTFLLLGVMGLQGRVNRDLLLMPPSDFYGLLFLGVVCTSLAFLLMIGVITHIGAFTASLTINLEPVYSIILAAILLAENELLGPRFYWGSAVILLVVFVNPLLAYLRKKGRGRHFYEPPKPPF